MDVEIAETATRADAAESEIPTSVSTASTHAPQALPALPDYLVRHYRWAYLWPASVWFFDHQPIINAILFGNYRAIMNAALRLMEPAEAGRTLQIAAVYGELTPRLARTIEDLHVIDVAPIQLEATARKLDDIGLQASLGLMNSEHLAYEDDSFDTAVMFFLLHELPPAARLRSLRHALRVLRPGGRLVIAEYGEAGRGHPFHRFGPFRWILTTAEPFLGGFWSEDLKTTVAGCAGDVGKCVDCEQQVDLFGGFYRVVSFRVPQPTGSGNAKALHDQERDQRDTSGKH